MIEFVFMLLFVVFGGPAILLFALAFWTWLIFWLDDLSRKKHARDNPPYCDIDPRCHPAFIWISGKGYIEGKVVIGVEDANDQPT